MHYLTDPYFEKMKILFAPLSGVPDGIYEGRHYKYSAQNREILLVKTSLSKIKELAPVVKRALVCGKF